MPCFARPQPAGADVLPALRALLRAGREIGVPGARFVWDVTPAFRLGLNGGLSWIRALLGLGRFPRLSGADFRLVGDPRVTRFALDPWLRSIAPPGRTARAPGRIADCAAIHGLRALRCTHGCGPSPFRGVRQKRAGKVPATRTACGRGGHTTNGLRPWRPRSLDYANREIGVPGGALMSPFSQRSLFRPLVELVC
jgi:hypothetical protein